MRVTNPVCATCSSVHTPATPASGKCPGSMCRQSSGANQAFPRFMVPMHGQETVGAFHEPAVPERGSVTRGTWGCSDALRLTEPRSHRVVRFMVPMHAKKRKGAG